MAISSYIRAARTRLSAVPPFIVARWRRFRTKPRWYQALVAALVVLVLILIVMMLPKGATENTEAQLPSVTLASLRDLAGSGSSVNVIGSVRSVTEAEILAQSGGTVTAVHTRLGASVPAGAVIAELENASQRAAVLQAEGSYEAALASKAGTSPTDIAATARNTYASAFTTLETLLKTDIDTFYGAPGAFGPQFLISYAPFDYNHFPVARERLADAMESWRNHLDAAATTDPEQLLSEADRVTHLATALGNDIAEAATKYGTDANSTQLAALASARSGFATVQASITSAKSAFQSQSTSATAGTDASVKIALGALRAAQANLEKTLIRAPIGGTVNFFPIRTGDYVTQLMHVATMAQNGTLEIVTNISEANRAQLSVGMQVLVEDQYPAVITSIAPALDPVTKQIEVRLAVKGASALVNGQSVRVALPSEAKKTTAAGPLLLPLTAVKLTPSARVVFTVDADGRLVAHDVQIGDVHGDRIEVLTALPGELRIVTDARGFSTGQKVSVAP